MPLAVNNKFNASLFFTCKGKGNTAQFVNMFNFEHILENKHNKLTPSQALLKAANYCAYQERCHKEVIEKLNEWGIYGQDAQEILLQLIEQNYLNEERFAIAFAGGKFRVNQWGKIKIVNELKMRDISPYCINKALLAIDEDTYVEALTQLAQKKWQEVKDANILSKRAKVARFLAGKGFEQELVWRILRNTNSDGDVLS